MCKDVSPNRVKVAAQAAPEMMTNNYIGTRVFQAADWFEQDSLRNLCCDTRRHIPGYSTSWK